MHEYVHARDINDRFGVVARHIHDRATRLDFCAFIKLYVRIFLYAKVLHALYNFT